MTEDDTQSDLASFADTVQHVNYRRSGKEYICHGIREWPEDAIDACAAKHEMELHAMAR